MSETTAFLVERLRSEAGRVTDFFNSLSAEQWDHVVYTDGAAWSIRHVLAHFVASEAAFTYLFSDILAGGPGAPEDLDLNQYNENSVGKLDDLSPVDLLELFERRRQKMVELVSNLQAADLAKTGRHPFLGIAPLEDMIKLIYRHQQIHIREIRRALSIH